jgi:predicted nuclease of predicted toxin-antitoxin system
MLFVFDENFSKNLADGLHLLEKSNPAGEKVPVDVISAEKFMGRRGATDLELYEAIGKRNGIVFTKDKDFKQIKLLEKIIIENRAKVLFFKPAKKFIFFWDILTAMVVNWDHIKETLNTQSPPYVYEFDIRAGISPRNF